MIADSVQIAGPMGARYGEVLTPVALRLLARLETDLGARRVSLLAARRERFARLEAGEAFGFLAETEHVRRGDWTVAVPAPGLVDRRVEITGPTDRKMTVNALNSGAKVWLADLEDASTPHWRSVIEGQVNLLDAVERRIDFLAPSGKAYELLPEDELATIVVRPRGLHLPEKHLLFEGRPTSGSFADFAIFVAKAGLRLAERGRGPYFYLPKLESHLEARLWNDAFVIAQEFLGLPRGTIRATVLIETLPAAFEMDEILFELREHSAGLNAGRWDYLFSIIKYFRSSGRGYVLPDRGTITMTAPFMRAYTDLLVRTCHRRGAHALGGMAAFIPSKNPEVNAQAFAKVADDKRREAGDGFDGSWVAHPGMVTLCKEQFDLVLGEHPNQLGRLREDVEVTAGQLLDVASAGGHTTLRGLRENVSVAVQYLRWWLEGRGAVAINDLMEDAATAEISRAQVWQWLHNGVGLEETGEAVTLDLVERVVGEEVDALGGDSEEYAAAASLFLRIATAEEFVDFLTAAAYEQID